MKSIIIILIFTFLPFFIFSQSYDEIKRDGFIDLEKYEYHDTIARNKYHDRLEIRLSYENEDGILVRREYSDKAVLLSEIEIIQHIVEDTFVVNSVINNGGGYSTSKRLYDLPNGNFVDYHLNTNIKSEGQCKDGTKIGKWTYYDIYKNKKIVYYNERGRLDGPIQFYYLKSDGSYYLKEEGQFSVYKIPSQYHDFSRKSGIWKFYSPSGELLEIATYEWQK